VGVKWPERGGKVAGAWGQSGRSMGAKWPERGGKAAGEWG